MRALPHLHRWLTLATCLMLGMAAVALSYALRREPPAPLAATAVEDDPEQLRERNRLAGEARRLELAGQFDDAIAQLKKRMALEQKVLGADHPEQVATLLELGRLHTEGGTLAEARQAFERAKVLAPADTWQFRDAEAGLAVLDASHGTHQAVRQELRKAQAQAEAGEFLAAVRTAEQALATEPTGRTRSETLFVLGSISREHGDTYPRAAGYLTSALAAIQQTHGTDHPLRAECLCALASLEEDRGAFIPAEQHLKEAQGIFKTTRGERSREYASALRQLGRMYAAWWISDSSDVCLRALQIREQILGREHPDCAQSGIDLGVLALNQHDYQRAVRLLRTAVTELEKAHGTDHPRVAEGLSWLGAAHTQRCEYTQARVCHRRALKIVERARGPRHLLYARYTVPFAVLCGDSERDYVRPRRMLEQAVRARDTLGCGEHPEQAYALSMLAMMYEGINQTGATREPAKATASYARARELFERIPAGKLNPYYVRTLSFESSAAFFSNYRHRSIEECKKLLAKAEKATTAQQAGRADHLHPFYRYVARARSRLAIACDDDADASIRHALEGFEAVRRIYGNDHPEHITDSVSVLYTAQIRYRRFAEALANIRLGLDAANRLSDELGGQAERSRLALLVQYYLTLSCALTVATELAGSLQEADVDDLYTRTLRFRGLVGARQAEDRLAFEYGEIAPKLAVVRAARSDLLSHLLTAPQGDSAREHWLGELARKTDAKEDLEADLAEACRPYASGRDLVAISGADVKATLPPDAVLIDYVQYLHFKAPPTGRYPMVREPRLGTFVVSRDRGPVFVPLGPVASVRSAVDRWRQDVANIQAGKVADSAASARQVEQLIWKPVTNHIRGAKQVLISPEGPLCFLPFAALPGREPGRYLIHEHTFGYLPSGRWLVDRSRRRVVQQARGLLSVGGIRYAGRPGTMVASRGGLLGVGEWDDLPGSEPEAQRAQALFRQHLARDKEPVALLKGTIQKEQLVAALTNRPRVFHFAGHGYFAGDEAARSLLEATDDGTEDGTTLSPLELQTFSRNQQLLSGLVLSGVNSARTPQERSATVLTAEEVGTLDLRGTELVVLSACETGLGNVAGNEGPLGLQRAFLNAGVGAVVTSLWKVDDAATSLLMQEFYSNLWVKKLPRLEALRQAQLKLMQMPATLVAQRGPRLTPVPFGPATPSKPECGAVLWAAFVMSGADQ
ncbi:MAG: CHAT domain-containing tetratricopeptide repeat protein [Gemmataceae bacterium]